MISGGLMLWLRFDGFNTRENVGVDWSGIIDIHNTIAIDINNQITFRKYCIFVSIQQNVRHDSLSLQNQGIFVIDPHIPGVFDYRAEI